MESLRPVRYLYVEDNAVLRGMVTLLIEQKGRTITAVGNAEEAQDAQLTQHFDVLLTDVSLPGLSGVDLAKQWVSADRSRWAILFSGYDLEASAIHIGPNVRALLKSSDPEVLEALLGQIDSDIRQTNSPKTCQTVA